jgi:hypothetical protein
MSYCHLLGGCSAELVFHPQSVALLAQKIEEETPAVTSAACILPDTGVGAAPPEIDALSPTSGSTAGGTTVGIVGSGFRSGLVVTFGGVPATAVTIQSPTHLTAVTPPHSAGTVAVRVTAPDGASDTLSPGFFYQAPPPATSFYTLPPCRAVDTRDPALGAPALASGQMRSFRLTGVCGIATSSRAVAANVTAVTPGGKGFIGVYPGDAFALGTSNVSFSRGQTRAVFSVVTLATDGLGTVLIHNGSSGSVHVVVDVTGSFR